MDSEQELREMYRAAAVIKEICNRRTEDDACHKSEICFPVSAEPRAGYSLKRFPVSAGWRQGPQAR